MGIDKSNSRREFIKKMGAASLSAAAVSLPTASFLSSCSNISSIDTSTADTVILLWMAGGMAAPDTFDPKHYEPFEVGTPAEKIVSTFPEIDTVVDNNKMVNQCAGSWKYKASGQVVNCSMVNVFTVKGGKITGYDVYVDTAAFAAGLTD